MYLDVHRGTKTLEPLLSIKKCPHLIQNFPLLGINYLQIILKDAFTRTRKLVVPCRTTPCHTAGLPNVFFSNRNFQFWFFEGLRLENVDIFHGHLEYCMDICDILWSFGTLCVHLVHFSRFCIVCAGKSGNPAKQLGSILSLIARCHKTRHGKIRFP
jgi:hypothetical protein